MNKYIGTKLIEAREMNLGDYNNYRSWTIPENDDPERKGYLVVYEDGYESESWSPKEAFERVYKKINGELEELESDLITTDNTYVMKDEPVFNSPHNYIIFGKTGLIQDILCGVHFQEGPLKEKELNGVFHEDLISIVIDRLKSFQKSDFMCKENAAAITKLEESLMWLRKRTLNRQIRGIQGTSKV